MRNPELSWEGLFLSGCFPKLQSLQRLWRTCTWISYWLLIFYDFFICFHCLAFKTLQILGRSWCFSWLLIGFQTLFSCFSQVSPFSQCCLFASRTFGEESPPSDGWSLEPNLGGLFIQGIVLPKCIGECVGTGGLKHFAIFESSVDINPSNQEEFWNVFEALKPKPWILELPDRLWPPIFPPIFPPDSARFRQDPGENSAESSHSPWPGRSFENSHRSLPLFLESRHDSWHDKKSR